MNIKGSYKDDCIFLLKDLTRELKEISVEEKENLISKGISYSNFISKEEKPSEEVEELFLNMVESYSEKLAEYIGVLSEKIYYAKKENTVIVSLARAGTPYGILIKKYIKFKYNIDIKHYSVSIIRGKGIDYNAIKYILDNNKKANIQFVDGWTGKGSIINELKSSIDIFNKKYNKTVDSSLAVIADPARRCSIYGTREDIAVPNSVLNSTVSGLVSRTVLNDKFIGKEDFHGAISIGYLAECDFSQYYVDKIVEKFKVVETVSSSEEVDLEYAINITKKVQEKYKVKDINKIKPSIGEASRVLLRRKARVILLKDMNDVEVKQLVLLAKNKSVKIEEFSDCEYKAIAIIEEAVRK
ncbi:MAG: cysteine protease StiP domain-containing protein [Sarcina sp.]